MNRIDDSAARGRTGADPRWVTWVTWIAILAPVPYGLSRLLWAAGIPVGISPHLLHHDLHSPGLGSLYILVLVVLCEGTAIFTHAFVLHRPERVPRWVPMLRGRHVRPWLVIAPLLMPIAILALFNEWSLTLFIDGFSIPADNAGVPGWSFWGQAATFLIWGLALTTATAVYWHATRGHGRHVPGANHQPSPKSPPVLDPRNGVS